MTAARSYRSAPTRFAVAVAAALIAASVRLPFDSLLGTRLGFLTFFPAVMFSGWFGGLAPGILCTLMSAALADFFWFEPRYSFALTNQGDVAAFALFTATGFVMSALNERVHRGRSREQAARRVAEDAEHRAQAAERRWVRLLQGAPTAMLTVNQRGSILFVNALTERLFGYSHGELIGKSVELLVPRRFSANHQRFRAGFSDAPEMRQMGIGRELFAVRKDGTEVPVEIGLNPIEVDGEVVVLASIVDITERKRAEAERESLLARFESLIAHAPIGIALFDTNLRVVSVNDRAADVDGISREAHLGRTVSELLPDVGPKAETLMRRVLDTGESIVGLEVSSATFAAGDGRQWIASYFPVKNRHQETIAVGVVALDITDRKRADTERAQLLSREQQARAEADVANRAKDLFLARVSHELRTPLNALMGWTRMLRDGTLDPDKASRAVASIDRNADVLNQLVEDLVEMSRAATGKLRLDRRHLDVVAVVRESAHLLDLSAAQKNIAVEMEAPAQTVTVDGDPTRLRQVFWNLLSNAIKFTPAEGRVALRIDLPGDDEVAIRVIDSGQGISPDFLPQVFEPFAQASHGGPGLGLGLAIVRQLVAAHGGRIDVASGGPGQGTTFTVRLPTVHPPGRV